MSTATTASASSGQFQAGGGQGRGGRGYRGDAPGGRGGGPPRGGRGGPVQIFADQRPAALESRFSAKEQDELVAIWLSATRAVEYRLDTCLSRLSLHGSHARAMIKCDVPNQQSVQIRKN